MIERDLRLVEITGARYHVAHVSTAAAIEAIRQAKAAGLPVTCDTAPPYFALNETAIGDYRTFAKLSPPLRSETRPAGGRRGLARRHDRRDRQRPRAVGPGFEAPAVQLGELRHRRAGDAAAAVAGALPQPPSEPARGVAAADDRRRPASWGSAVGRLAAGAPADLVLFDPDAPWRIRTDAFRSKSKNAPFDGRPVQGRVERTIVDGRTIFARGE